MPAYNSEKYIGDSIRSVLNQSYHNWELLIINDGSTDGTKNEIFNYTDDRIIYLEQIHQGVSSARNTGLSHMTGDFFCFLDSDDILPNGSLMSRLKVFYKNPNISFVDGKVIHKNIFMNITIHEYTPKFIGYPFHELIKISNKCFFGNTWMIKREKCCNYFFNENMTHAEDICFYISISENREYNYTTDVVLYYRDSTDSAMTDFSGLEEGYKSLFLFVKNLKSTNYINIIYLKYRIIRIMFLSYLFDKNDPLKAFGLIIKYLFL